MVQSHRLCLFVFIAAAWIAASPTVADGQWIARRIGERILENAQRRVVVAPSQTPRGTSGRVVQATPAIPSQPRPAPSNRANYNSPIVRSSEKTVVPASSSSVLVPANSLPASPPLSTPTRVGDRDSLGVIVSAPPVTGESGKTPRPPRGALVVASLSGSGAANAGLMPGDIIVSIDGRLVPDVDQYRSQLASLASLSPGKTVEVKYIRAGSLRAVNRVVAASTAKPSVAPEISAPNEEDPFNRGFESIAETNAMAVPPIEINPPMRTLDLPSPITKSQVATTPNVGGNAELPPPKNKSFATEAESKSNASSDQRQAAIQSLKEEIKRLQERVNQLEFTSK